MKTTNPTVVLFSNPTSRVRRLRYMVRIDVCINLPVGGPRSRAHVMSLDTARTIVQNLRARGMDACCEDADYVPGNPRYTQICEAR